MGPASISTSHGHSFHVRPSHIFNQSPGATCAISIAPTTASNTNGTASSHNPRKLIASGRARRDTSTIEKIPSDAV